MSDSSFVGRVLEALRYSRQFSSRTEVLASLMWSVVVKDREERYPEFFNPVVWQQLELRLARALSHTENHLSLMLAAYKLHVSALRNCD